MDNPSYPAEIKQSFRDETEILQTKDASNIYTTLHLLCVKQDVEKFYLLFWEKVVLPSTLTFPTIQEDAATILCQNLATILLGDYKKLYLKRKTTY